MWHVIYLSSSSFNELSKVVEIWYLDHYKHFCKVFLAPIYVLLFYKPCLILFKGNLVVLGLINSWYIEGDDNYIQIYKCTSSLHIFLNHILGRLVIMDASYQIIEFGSYIELKEHEKCILSTYPLTIRDFIMKYFFAILVKHD